MSVKLSGSVERRLPSTRCSRVRGAGRCAGGRRSEVVAALGADVEVGFELGFEEDGAAAGALDPEALGADAGRTMPNWTPGEECK
jgi:hypothetical protein